MAPVHLVTAHARAPGALPTVGVRSELARRWALELRLRIRRQGLYETASCPMTVEISWGT